jgi:hypothetical protein
MSACPTFSNLTFSRMPVKLSCILLPLLLTYPCAFGSLVWEQLVELLLQKWPDGAKPCSGVLDLMEAQRKLHRSNRKDPHCAPVLYRGHERRCGLLSLAPTPRSHCTPLSSTRRVQLFPSNVFSFHDIYPVLTQAKSLCTNFAKPKGQLLRAVPPPRIRIPITTPYLQQTQNSDHFYLNSRRQPQDLCTLHIHPPVWRERITKATPSWATILPILVPHNSKSNPPSQTSP